MMNESSSITLLLLVQEVAYCDGSMSQDEEDLIMTLIESYGLQEDRIALQNRLVEGYSSTSQSMARGSSNRIARDELLSRVSALETREEQDLAVKLAYLTAMVSRDPEDLSDINVDELNLFQMITAALRCPDERVKAIQWAADEELNEWCMPSLKQVLIRWLG